MLPKVVKFTEKTEKELLQKIKTKKSEPFAKIELVVLPVIVPDLLKFLKTNDIAIKQIAIEKPFFRMEI